MKSKSWLQIAAYTVLNLAIFNIPALADQCAYISKQQAIAAISRLDTNQTIYKLCEPCGEKIAEPTFIQHLAIEKVDYEDYWQVAVNGSGIDLAYVFVNSNIANQFINLAAIANCPAEQVSPLLPPNSIKLEN